MRTKKIVPAILAAIISLNGLTACSGGQKTEWNNTYLTTDEIKSAGLGKFTDAQAKEMISDEGEQYFNSLLSEMDSIPDEEMFNIAYGQGVMVYPAENGGYFMTAGYDWKGSVGVLWNEIYYLSGGESKVLYSGESNDYIVAAASQGDCLYLLWQDGVLSSLDSAGTLTELCNMRKNVSENVSMGIDSTLKGKDNSVTATVEFRIMGDSVISHRTDKVVYDIDTKKAEITEGSFAEE